MSRDLPVYSRRWYRKCRASGLCVRCGRLPADGGYVSCIGCRQRRGERVCGEHGKWAR